MITFSQFTKNGGFGNQMFQYAYLRTMAKKLGVKFYCQAWAGDGVFDLNDSHERSFDRPDAELDKFYHEPRRRPGFNQAALEISDGTDVNGYFQSARYYRDINEVKKWYTFRQAAKKVREKYQHIDFSSSVSLSLRIDDDYNCLRFMYPLYPLKYYEKALQRVNHKEHILIFSDRLDRARLFFRNLDYKNIVFIDETNTYEALYLMTLCHDNIISNSTFSWWGAWLGKQENKAVVAPQEWFRPGYKIQNSDIACDDWLRLKSLHPIYDYYPVFYVLFRLKRKAKNMLQAYYHHSTHV